MEGCVPTRGEGIRSQKLAAKEMEIKLSRCDSVIFFFFFSCIKGTSLGRLSSLGVLFWRLSWEKSG